MKELARRQIQTIFALSSKKIPATRTGTRLAAGAKNCHSVSEYWSFCARIASCCPGAFSYLWGRNIGPTWPEPCPRCRSPPPRSDFPAKDLNGGKADGSHHQLQADKPWPWRSRWKSMNFLTGPTTKPRTCPMSSGGIGMGREFDEYIVATEGVGIYGETPEGNTFAAWKRWAS